MEALLGLFRLASTACGTNSGALPSIWDNLPNCSLVNGVPTPTINSVSDILIIVGNVVRILIVASGGLALIVVLAAAIFYITSQGDPARVKRAKDIMQQAATGIVLILISYALMTYIASKF